MGSVGCVAERFMSSIHASSFAVAFFKDSPGQDGAYQVQHSSQIYLVDARGNLRAEFYDASIDTIETITRMVLEESAGAESAS